MFVLSLSMYWKHGCEGLPPEYSRIITTVTHDNSAYEYGLRLSPMSFPAARNPYRGGTKVVPFQTHESWPTSPDVMIAVVV